MARNKRIVAIVSAISQPRVIKRLSAINDTGFDIVVYGYSRNKYNCNKFPDNIEVKIIGELEDGRQYIKRLFRWIRDIKEIISKEQDAVYYSTSIIFAFILLIYKVRYIYELSDIFYGYKKFNLIRPILKLIDKHIIKRSCFTIVTSQGFVDYLFPNKKNIPENIIVQPNKLNRCFLSYDRTNYKKPNIESLNFAYVGAIRYTETILRFAKIVGSDFPMHSFTFYGESSNLPFFKECTKDYSNVHYKGAFKNPEDLAEIYSNIDIVVACYENLNLNERIAEPNKLYEARFFTKPIIVSDNTFLAEQVKDFNCGYVINAYDDNEIRFLIKSIKKSDIERIQKIEQLIPAETLVDNASNIIQMIKSSIK